MKKNLVYAMMLVAAMSSCSKDSDAPTTPGTTTPIDDTTPAEIQLTAGVNASVLTRGSGIVGDTETSGNNKWSGQKLMIYAYGNDVTDFSTSENFLIANKEATMRTGDWASPTTNMAQTNVLRWTNREILYYPLTGSFEFYGYHVDDAFTGNPAYTADAVILANVTINGTQDLMIAKATLTKADSIKLYNNDNPSTPIQDGTLTDEQKAAIKAESLAKVYSAWSARREIQPNLNFQHLLSSFKFSVRPGKNNMNKVFIDSIKIVGNNTADMIVVGTNRGLGTTSNETNFYLNKKYADATTIGVPAFDIATQENADMTADTRSTAHPDTYLAMAENSTGAAITDYADFGLGMMLFPDVASYKVIIYTSERVITKEADPTNSVTYPEESEWKFASVETNITAPKGGNFLAGTMYNVKLTIYDRQRIEISATLTPWEEGGNIEENLE